MANLLCGEFKKGEFGHIDLCYTKFVSMLSQQPSAIPVLPLKDLTDEQDTKSIRNLILYEPDASEVFDCLLYTSIDPAWIDSSNIDDPTYSSYLYAN